MIHRLALNTLSRMVLSAVILLTSALTLANSYSPSNQRYPSLRNNSPALYGLNIFRAERLTLETKKNTDKTPTVFDKTVFSAFYDAIDTLETEMGPFNPALSQTLNQLGEALQDQGQHLEAISVFKRAVHVARIDQGLYTPEQVPTLKRIISSYLALKNFAKSDDTHEYLYFVEGQNSTRNPTEIFESQAFYAQWQRAAYLRERNDEQHRRLLKLYEIHQQSVLRLETENPLNEALVTHYYSQLDTLYLLDQHPGIEPLSLRLSAEQERAMALESRERTRLRQLNRNPYSQGLKILSKIEAIVQGKERQPEKQKLNLARGDWHTWFGRSSQAKSAYKKASQADGIFNSEPLELPLSSPSSPDEFNKPNVHRGRVSLAFNINKQGDVRKMEVIALHAQQGKASSLAVKRLVQQLKFRPKLEQGISVDTRVVREYNFRY